MDALLRLAELPHELVGTLAKNLLAGTPEKNDALKAVFAPMATLPLLRSFRDTFQWYEEYLRKGGEEDLRWVKNCAALPMQETQFFGCALGQHKAGCTKEQAEFRSRALEMMGAPSTWRDMAGTVLPHYQCRPFRLLHQGNDAL